MSEFERLTGWDGEFAYMRECFERESSDGAGWEDMGSQKCNHCKDQYEIFRRLAQYEDIGSPEEFAELAKAKTDGKLVKIPDTGIGDLSDGYHTFNELYEHRCILFSVICNQNKNLAWKSKQHHDGTMFDGMFIVGLDTGFGQATYHYELDQWCYFNVKELTKAPEWDGHTSYNVLNRLICFGIEQALKGSERS
jgi:hypothetical protein